jgi:hypothetical protein
MTIGLLALLLGCPPASRTQKENQADAASVAGRWKGTNAGLTVSLTIRQIGDSVTGEGTFEVAPNASIGCGGETLPSSGAVTLSGKLAANDLQSRMTFADTWSPPYIGTRNVPDSIDGHFMSIDRGGCPLALVRQH